MIALVMYSCLAGRAASAHESGYSDDEVKAQFVEAGMFCHAEFIRGGYRRGIPPRYRGLRRSATQQGRAWSS